MTELVFDYYFYVECHHQSESSLFEGFQFYKQLKHRLHLILKAASVREREGQTHTLVRFWL